MPPGTRERDDARQIDEILRLLHDVARGVYRQLDGDLPETDPFGLLYRGVNEAVAALATARDRALAYQHELEGKLSVIERQREAIRELSTPVIEVWAGVLCLPIVGVVDTARSTEMTDVVLDAVVKGSARCVIIDITGIEVMDTRTTDQLIRMAKIIQLLDARCFVTGISPAIAQTIDQMGVDISSIAIRRNLRDALKEYVADRHAARRSVRPPPGGDSRSRG
jgi:rsbT co-antagonist protein RsbR